MVKKSKLNRSEFSNNVKPSYNSKFSNNVKPPYNSKFSIDLYSLQFSQASYKDFVITGEFTDNIGNSLIKLDNTYPVKLEFTATNAKLGYYLKGKIFYKLQGQCSRCLAGLTDKTIINEFTAFFTEQNNKNEDCETYQLWGNIINLEPIIFDTVGSNIDYNPICGEGCKGLCSNCGVNLNTSFEHNC
ncbi:MAG: DUF177 domain-containing protein [Bifidobacteriaceae bacterium]|jgi:uncharacterized protein|nr:DUF177 domain-containing protein [Bifidobacteriaceae bacterium]